MRTCKICGLEKPIDQFTKQGQYYRHRWGKPAPLELEHINGNNRDNGLDNLTILCPNCHALTETYRGKNIGKRV